MIGKILLTVAVIVLAVIYLRKRAAVRRLEAAARQRAAPASQVDQFLTAAHSSPQSHPDTWKLNRTLRWLLWSLAFIALLSGSLYTYHRWQDNNRELTILLYRDGGTAPVVYRVPRHSLGEHSFVTHDGIRVTVSATERMEVIGL